VEGEEWWLSQQCRSPGAGNVRAGGGNCCAGIETGIEEECEAGFELCYVCCCRNEKQLDEIGFEWTCLGADVWLSQSDGGDAEQTPAQVVNIGNGNGPSLSIDAAQSLQ
jgi:hypothetical protein